MNSTFLLKRVSGSMYLVFLTPIPHSVQTFQVVLLGRIRTPADQPVCFRVKAIAWYRQNVQVFSCSWQLHVLLKLLCTQYVLHVALFMLWIFRNRYWGLSFFKKKKKKSNSRTLLFMIASSNKSLNSSLVSHFLFKTSIKWINIGHFSHLES